MKITGNIPFSTNKISTTPIILPKQNSTTITIVDGRINATKWKLYLSFNNPMIEQMGKVLIDSLAFKKFNNDYTVKEKNNKQYKIKYLNDSSISGKEQEKVSLENIKKIKKALDHLNIFYHQVNVNH